MNRRQYLTGAAPALLLSTAGCLSSSPDSKEYPKIPDPLTREAAVDFVEEYDTAAYHNAILEGNSPTSISVRCSARFDREVDSSLYVVSRCSGSTETEGLLRPATASEYASVPRTYRVTDERFQRVDVETTRGDGEYPVRVFNFDDGEHEVALTVTPATKSSDEKVLDDAYTLSSETGFTQLLDVSSGTTYELAVVLNDQQSTSFEWTVHDDPRGVGVYVTPDGGLDIATFSDDNDGSRSG
ncbi:hypothetical protein [Natronobacterium texcoconense]|uniref:Ig-like domain-containing protein n=1 Tax=Natronobacterium texcoconense TaxID=1095778 RepID=A0A1H1FQB3_NATTX|nr:hypothetical protein [Natronobacterium texcoconense]SDR03253.1 hypothetical protein SAMN04489842_2073 [Natronobacterium texcoconense]